MAGHVNLTLRDPNHTGACSAVRGRPRTFDTERALAAALRVFWQFGYEGSSLTLLTEAMGITRPSLYAYFGSKEELFRKALDLYEKEKLAFVGAALAAPSTREVVEQLLHGVIATYCGDLDPQGCLGINVAAACGVEAQVVRKEVIARIASGEAALVGRFNRAKEEGDLPAQFEARDVAQYFSVLCTGLAIKAGMGVPKETLENVIASATAFWRSDTCPAALGND